MGFVSFGLTHCIGLNFVRIVLCPTVDCLFVFILWYYRFLIYARGILLVLCFLVDDSFGTARTVLVGMNVGGLWRCVAVNRFSLAFSRRRRRKRKRKRKLNCS